MVLQLLGRGNTPAALFFSSSCWLGYLQLRRSSVPRTWPRRRRRRMTVSPPLPLLAAAPPLPGGGRSFVWRGRGGRQGAPGPGSGRAASSKERNKNNKQSELDCEVRWCNKKNTLKRTNCLNQSSYIISSYCSNKNMMNKKTPWKEVAAQIKVATSHCSRQNATSATDSHHLVLVRRV